MALPQFEELKAVPPDVEVRLVDRLADRQEVGRHGDAILFSDGARYSADDGTLIDIYGSHRIDIHPGKGWQGIVPIHFYGTGAAMLLALRGLIPIHGTALEIDGRAVLLCGRSGAGKSTMAAHLLALGARLISDDLSVLRVALGERPRLLAGRPGIRLHPDTAAWLAGQCGLETVRPSHDDKLVVRPPRVAPFSEHPLQRIILLDQQETALPAPLQMSALRMQIFRRRLMRRLPGHDRRKAALMGLAREIGTTRMRDLSQYDRDHASKQARRLYDMLDAPVA